MPPNKNNFHWFNLLHQVQLRNWRRDHGHQDKFWALISGDEDAPNDTNGCCPVRTPSPNEVKLMAWLAVACDVDGIMWYNFNFGGLIKWDNPSASFQPTERYSAAKGVCNDILRVAPILENLEFVKTYASRAFESNYPDSIYAATQRDVIASNTGWYGNPYRCVEEIVAYPPDGNGWLQTAENHPYVQVSRFRNPMIDESDPTLDDYWFLIVNRRALEEERRKIRLVIQIDSAHINSPYYIDYILGDSMKSAPPCAERVPGCAIRYLDVVLQPGEAELVHFYRGESGCDTTLAYVDSLTIIHCVSGTVKLDWNEVTETIEGYPYQAEMYFILGSPRFQGPYTPIDTTSNTSYIDSVFVTAYPRYYYQVQACGNATPGQVSVRDKRVPIAINRAERLKGK
ncbi:hypothetical protein EHM69_11325 [candidate division KSB1 bacterium]|nr:MAG: hypothetical protein EHM69_11325 [candidate division KSB1 bacterium]